MLIKFTYFHDKQKLPFDTINIPKGIQVQDSKNCGCRDIELFQDMIFKYCINAPELCSNIVAYKCDLIVCFGIHKKLKIN